MTCQRRGASADPGMSQGENAPQKYLLVRFLNMFIFFCCSLCECFGRSGPDSLFNSYTQSGCVFECRLRGAVGEVGCLPWDFPHFGGDGGLSVCDNLQEQKFRSTYISYIILGSKIGNISPIVFLENHSCGLMPPVVSAPTTATSPNTSLQWLHKPLRYS